VDPFSALLHPSLLAIAVLTLRNVSGSLYFAFVVLRYLAAPDLSLPWSVWHAAQAAQRYVHYFITLFKFGALSQRLALRLLKAAEIDLASSEAPPVRDLGRGLQRESDPVSISATFHPSPPSGIA
jgi:hypothetical protein